jgi:hypothetical protein
MWLSVGAGMTQIEIFKYFGACRPPQALGSAFGAHQYADNDEDPDEHAADLTDDPLEDERAPS